MLSQTDIKLYRSRIINPRRGNQLTEIYTSPAPNIPPNMFLSTTRIAAERFPLILRETSTTAKRTKNGRKGKVKVVKTLVIQAGIDALKNFGYDRVLDNSNLVSVLKGQEEEQERGREREREREKASVVALEKKRPVKSKQRKAKRTSRSRSASKARRRTEDSIPPTVTSKEP